VHPRRRRAIAYALFGLGHLPLSSAAAVAASIRGMPRSWRTSLSTNGCAWAARLPKLPVANGIPALLTAYAADPILRRHHAFGARGFNSSSPLRARGTWSGWRMGPRRRRPGLVLRGASALLRLHHPPCYVRELCSTRVMSPVPQRRPQGGGGGETLEYALYYFAISRLSQDLHRLDGRTFTAALAELGDLFDTADGYFGPRDGSGAFPSLGPRCPASPASPERIPGGATRAADTWMVPQNLQVLIPGPRRNHARGRLAWTPTSPMAQRRGRTRRISGRATSPRSRAVALRQRSQPWKTQALVSGRSGTHAVPSDPRHGGEPGNDTWRAMSSCYFLGPRSAFIPRPRGPELCSSRRSSALDHHGVFADLTINAGVRLAWGVATDVGSQLTNPTPLDRPDVGSTRPGGTNSTSPCHQTPNTLGTAAADAAAVVRRLTRSSSAEHARRPGRHPRTGVRLAPRLAAATGPSRRTTPRHDRALLLTCRRPPQPA